MAWPPGALSSFDAKRPEETLRLVDSLSALTRGLSRTSARTSREQGPSFGPFRPTSGARPRRRWPEETSCAACARTSPTSDAAVYSYIVWRRDRYAQQDKVIDAERLLTKLADDFPSSTYAPYALYQAALQAERLGTDANLKEAYKFLENLVTNPRYATSDLIFPARMRQW